MGIKNKLTVTRGEWGGDDKGKKGRGKQRNMNRGLMRTDNGVGTDCRSRVGDRAKERNGGKGRTTITEQQ